MKKLAILWLACLLLVLPGTAAGQGGSGDKSRTSKAFTVSGQVSQDGKKLIGKNGEPWLVENPDALAGHEGQRVKVKCIISSGSRDVRVLSLKKVATETRYGVNLGDSAFRR